MNILMIRLSAMGDVVRTLPALTCLRRAYPSDRITWLVEPASAEILASQTDLDETLVFPRADLSRALLYPGEILRARDTVAGFIQTLKQRRFDLVIDFQGTLKSGLMARLTRAPRRVGLGPGHAREMAYLFYTERARLPRARMSRVDRALALVAHLGVDTRDATSSIPERPEDAAYVELFLSALKKKTRDSGGYAAPLSPAVVFPGTSRRQAYKRYPPDNFARAADLVAERTGAPVVVAWGPGEEELAGEVISSMRSPATLAPSLTLGQLTALIRRSKVFLAGDTGPMHIAWTVGTPVVAIYGPTDPVVNNPGGDHSAVAYRKIFCSPCRNRGCIARTCLEHLPAETVAGAALQVIERAESGRPRSLPVSQARHADKPQYLTMGPGVRPPRID